ncbi:MAG: MFS transporter, partial [Chloroflexota bacterium]
VQGRVFSARRIIAFFFVPFTAIIAGPLSDFVLEPAMKVESSTLSTVFSNIVGTGPGSGMALIFVFCGLFTALVGMIGYLTPLISNVESIVPDHDAQSANSSTETTAA